MSDLLSEYNDLSKDMPDIVDISTIFVPYSPANDPDSKKWAILGTYSQKTTEQLQHDISETERNTGNVISEDLLSALMKQYEKKHEPREAEEAQDYNRKAIHVITLSDKKNAIDDLIEFNDDIGSHEDASQWLEARGLEPPKTIKTDIDLPAEKESISQKDGYVEAPPWDDEFWQDDDNVVFWFRSALMQKHKEQHDAKIGTAQQLLSMSVPAAHSIMTDNTLNMVLSGINAVIFGILAVSYKGVDNTYDELLKLDAQDYEIKKNPDISRKKRLKLLKEGMQHLGISISSIKPTSKEEYKHFYHDIIEEGRKRGYRPPKKISHNDIANAGENIRNTSDKQARSITDQLLSPVKTMAAYTLALSNGTNVETNKDYVDSVTERLKSKTKNAISAPISMLTHTDIETTRQSLSYIRREHAPRIARNLVKSVKDQAEFGASVLQASWDDVRHLDKSKSGLIDGFKGWVLKSEHSHASLKAESHSKISQIENRITAHSEIMHTQKTLRSIEDSKETLESLKNYEGIKIFGRKTDHEISLPHTNFALATGANAVSIGSLVYGLVKLDPVNVVVNTWDILMGGLGANFKTGSILYQHAREKHSFLAQAAKNKEDLVKLDSVLHEISEAQKQLKETEDNDHGYKYES